MKRKGKGQFDQLNVSEEYGMEFGDMNAAKNYEVREQTKENNQKSKLKKR